MIFAPTLEQSHWLVTASCWDIGCFSRALRGNCHVRAELARSPDAAGGQLRNNDGLRL